MKKGMTTRRIQFGRNLIAENAVEKGAKEYCNDENVEAADTRQFP